MKLHILRIGILIAMTSVMILPAFADNKKDCDFKKDETTCTTPAPGCTYSVGIIHSEGNGDAGYSWLNQCKWVYNNKNATDEIATANANLAKAKAANNNIDIVEAEVALAAAEKGTCKGDDPISKTLLTPYTCGSTDNDCNKAQKKIADDC